MLLVVILRQTVTELFDPFYALSRSIQLHFAADRTQLMMFCSVIVQGVGVDVLVKFAILQQTNGNQRDLSHKAETQL